MKFSGLKTSSSMQHDRGFVSTEKVVVVAVLAIVAMMAVPNFQQQRKRAVLTDGVIALARYSVEMERFNLVNGSYGKAQPTCGVQPPTSNKLLSFSCRTDGDSYAVTLRGIGALDGYEYILDTSSRPRRTERYAGAPVHARCWLKNTSNCYS